jgi:hypothetical protein
MPIPSRGWAMGVSRLPPKVKTSVELRKPPPEAGFLQE